MPAHVTKERFFPPLWVLTLLVIAGAVWLLIQLKEIAVLLVVGFCVSYTIEPLLDWLEARKIRRGLGIVLVVVVFLAVVLLLALTALPTFVREFRVLSENLPGYLETVQVKFAPYLEQVRQHLPADQSKLVSFENISSIGKGALERVVQAVWNALMQGYSITLTLVNLLLLPFIIFYISMDFPTLFEKTVKIFPRKQRTKVASVIKEMNTYVSAFVRGQITVCALLVVLYEIGLGLVGIELWFLVAIIAGVGNLVPYVGSLIGIVLATIMALVTYGDFSHVFMVWGVFAVVQFLEGSFITPRIMGDKVGLSPLVIIIALVAGGKLFGLLGIFVAVPVAAILKVLSAHAHEWVLARAS